jgi:hypothetical protein
MKYATKPNKTKLARVAAYLRDEGFVVGLTHTGLVAIDDDGLVIQASPCRTSAQIYHPILKVFREEYEPRIAETCWLGERIAMLIEWAKDKDAVELPHIIGVSRRPVPSRASRAILASICTPSAPTTISSTTYAQPLNGKA